MTTKAEIGEQLRDIIAYYTALSIDERDYQEQTEEVAEAWKDIENLIDLLTEQA